MQLTALEMQHLINERDARSDELIEIHHELHALVIDNQDDACTVDATIAVQILALLQRFALVRFNKETGEYFAVSLMREDSLGQDVVWCSLYVMPESDGRFSTTSASDRSKYFLSVA